MQVHKRFRLFLAFTVGLIASDIARSEAVLGRVTVSVAVAGEAHAVVIPSGFRLELLTEALQSPRLLAFASDGDLFIGSKSGRVYRLRPPYREPEVFANPGGYLMTCFQREDGSRWARPVGVAVGPDGALYFTSDAGANALFRLSPGNDQPRG